MFGSRQQVAVVGVGHSRVFRRAEVPLGVLAAEAVQEAVADAGLELGDIDGLSTTPHQPAEGIEPVDGITIVSPEFMARALGLSLAWSERQLRPIGASMINTVHAVAAGQCRYAVCFRGLHNPADRRYGHRSPTTVSGPGRYTDPYGAFAPGVFALLATEHMHRYGSTREQLGQFVVRNRQQALLWEHGYWAQHGAEPLTMEDYLGARMISTPLGLHDCDLPIQVAAAFVITTGERAVDLRQRPAYVLGSSSPFTVAMFDQRGSQGGYSALDEYIEHGQQTARFLWRNTGIGPADVDLANLYDGFSIETPLWAESLGLCEVGAGFEFVANPTIPLNTSSGNLGSGRSHGISHLMDSVLQIQGRAGPRQIADAEIALAATNQTPAGQAIVFSRSPG
jgi:acetyl-CoA acetyltransferase